MNNTNIYLQSDFNDYYDDNLHDPNSTKVFKRLTKSGLNRREMLKFLDKNELQTVPHGTVEELYKKYYKNKENWNKTKIKIKPNFVVVYLDENLHRGEGKELLDIEKAYKLYPEKYASIFLSLAEKYSVSYRELYIGDIVIRLSYINDNDWRSNVNTKLINFLSFNYISEKDKRLDYPLYALDYLITLVDNSYDKFYIDLNVAPGMPEKVYTDIGLPGITEFSKILYPEVIVHELKKYI